MYRGQVYVELDPRTRLPVRLFRHRLTALLFEPASLVSVWPRKDAVESVRRRVYARSEGACEYCGVPITWDFHMHEQVERSKGGEISLQNSVALCAKCHEFGPDAAHKNRRLQFTSTSKTVV